MLKTAPDLVNRAPKYLVKPAVSTGRAGAVALVLDLGFDPNCVDDNAAIHQAGDLAKNPEILRILLARGASLTLRDPWYDSTGIGWADFFDYRTLRDRLLDEKGICLFDAPRLRSARSCSGRSGARSGGVGTPLCQMSLA